MTIAPKVRQPPERPSTLTHARPGRESPIMDRSLLAPAASALVLPLLALMTAPAPGNPPPEMSATERDRKG